MSNTNTLPNYGEITQLSNTELVKRAKAALDTFMKTIKQGGNVAEKARLYNAYQDEWLKRFTFKNVKFDSKGGKRSSEHC